MAQPHPPCNHQFWPATNLTPSNSLVRLDGVPQKWLKRAAMDQLKKAMQKAGLFSSEQSKVKERKRKQVKLDDERKGHEIRNQCLHCDEFQPNVELYEHRNRAITAKWLCVKCADVNNISDDFRMTAQSPDCRNNMFNRQYGHTRKDLTKKGPPKKTVRVGR